MSSEVLGVTLAGVALAGAVVIGLGAVGMRRAKDYDPVSYLAPVEGEVTTDSYQEKLRESALQRVFGSTARRMGSSLGRLTPRNYLDQMHQRLLIAGLLDRVRAEDFVAMQVLAAGAGFLLGLLMLTLHGVSFGIKLLALVGIPVIGFAYPYARLKSLMEKRQLSIRNDLPDVLDLLSVAVEAGTGFEGAMALVTANFTSPLGVELARTLKEMELGLPRREALTNLKRRCEVPDLSNFVLALVQADALGMPVGRILKAQADEMRLRRRQYAREKAAKLPVKILFPTILFIFPAIFVVLAGPAAVEIYKALQHISL
jgi:tight adherence protein C